jgi:transcriptional regulator with XRE-family HTH domain
MPTFFTGSSPAALMAEPTEAEGATISPTAMARLLHAVALGAFTSLTLPLSSRHLDGLRLAPLSTSATFDFRITPNWVLAHEEPGARLPADMLATIRSFLSFTVVETSQVLGVERPTVYAWLAGRAEPQARNRERLHRVFQVAKSWSRLSDRPLGVAVRHADDAGSSVLSLLLESRFEEATRLLQALAQRERNAEPRVRVPSVRDVIARHGLTDRIKPSMDEVDRLTGKRFGPD